MDCVGLNPIPVRDQRTIVQTLEESDFQWAPRGTGNPPAACFRWPSLEEPEVEIEFLTPKRGSGVRRVATLQNGLTAQTLWHLDILLDNPLSLTVNESPGASAMERFHGQIRVPRLGHFLIQKGLIHNRRPVEARVKDLFYVFDVIDSENGMAEIAQRDVLAAYSGGWASAVMKFIDTIGGQFESSAVVKQVTEQFPPEKAPLPGYIQAEAASWFGSLSQVAS